MSDITQTTDAAKWTDEFLRIFPDGCSDYGTMLGWFANAIEVGRDDGAREERERRALTTPGEDLEAVAWNIAADTFPSTPGTTEERILAESIMQALQSECTRAVTSFAQKILHGDDEHEGWRWPNEKTAPDPKAEGGV